MSELIAVGYWYSEPWLRLPDNNDYPDPRSLVDDDWCAGDRDAICSYLDGGFELAHWRGLSYCRFDCGIDDSEMGSGCLTDGVWVWPEGLSHYVREHHVRLPNDFVNHMRSCNWLVAPLTSEFDRDDRSFEFWIRWGRENVA